MHGEDLWKMKREVCAEVDFVKDGMKEVSRVRESLLLGRGREPTFSRVKDLRRN